MKELWDVYVWPMDCAGNVTLVAKGVDYDTAMEHYNKWFDTNIYDAYMVPTGTKLFMF